MNPSDLIKKATACPPRWTQQGTVYRRREFKVWHSFDGLCVAKKGRPVSDAVARGVALEFGWVAQAGFTLTVVDEAHHTRVQRGVED